MDATHAAAGATGAKNAAFEGWSWRTAWKKAPFLACCWVSYFLFVTAGALIFYLMEPRLNELNPWLAYAALAFIGACLLILGGGLFLITVTALTGFDLLYPHRKQSITVRFLFPLAAMLGHIVGVSRRHLRTSFVKVNNALTIAQKNRIRRERILILLPHCLQVDVCNRKITTTIDNCVACGRCPVGRLREMGAKYGLKIEVVNGGTLARRRVVEFRPDGIVAVACERDLTLGIQDAYPVPVYGVINDRPNGPCYNTDVDLALVEEGIRFFRATDAVAAGAN